MDIMKLAAELVAKQFSGQGNVSEGSSLSALQGLFGGNNIDIGSLVSKLSSSDGLASQVQSWLGDGGNDKFPVSQIMEIFGGQPLQKFSDTLGVNQDDAAGGLSEVLPQLIDKCSSGGALLESVGGIGGALNMAKGLFK